jgi:hypothetical protein
MIEFNYPEVGMKLKKTAAFLLILISVTSLHSQVVKAAIIAKPGNALPDFYNILSERSGISIHQIPLLPQEVEHALAEGLVDIAILPENDRIQSIALIQTPVSGSPLVLIGESGYAIHERNMIDLRTVAVFVEDEQLLQRELIDKFSIEPRIQKARHYDSLVRIMATGRVTAIVIPMKEFERSLLNINEDRNKFGQPFVIGFKESFLFLSRRRAEKLTPLMDKLIQALEEMKNDGTVEELNNRL